jgi:hypothetical protein
MSGTSDNKEWFFSLETSFDKILDRSQLPDNVDALKDLLISTTQESSDKINALFETVDYLNGQLSIFRRFQYGQRSERLKKKLK